MIGKKSRRWEAGNPAGGISGGTMRVTGVVLACSLLLGAVAACGLSERGSGAAVRKEELSRARQALAGVDDPSVDFTESAGGAWQPPFHPKSARCGKLFDFADGRLPDTASTAEAASFQGSRLGESAGVVLAAYDPGAARRVLRDVAALMRDCPVASAKSAGGGDRLVGSELPLTGIGDGIEARRYKGRVGGYPYEMHLVVVRSGDMLISLVHTGMARLDPGRTGRMATVLAAKVRESAE